MDKKEELSIELTKLKRRREDIEDYYNNFRRRVEEMDEAVGNQYINFTNRVNSDSSISSDSELIEIYSEREKIFSDMRMKQRDIYEQLNEEYKKNIDAVEKEENEIRKKLSEKASKEKGE
ncbi:MAG: hypothetical protein IJJ59_02550 [Pseudobutyrivibrio sp.]|uniref:hypothetical protein n=1 Tax=Pseudobutyrivibrio sp. TaxID=2014367 RepID=UPI0025E8E0FD|nr:hypothetical protein [Pseudobutyrivibrio sp.]MBQ6462188.1 hypothetical protein [Pseudobutyrivibrio sp.]